MPDPAAACPDAQKKHLIASEQDPVARAAWQAAIQEVAADQLVFVDESGAKITLSPRYGRAPRGQRCVGRVPRNWGQNTTLMAAMTLEGMQTAAVIEGAMDRPVFECFVQQFLLPTLRPGQTVVWDNLSVHKSQRARALIEAMGCDVVFLPAYSPDFNPIEQAFSKLKAHLRRIGARTYDDLIEAIGDVCDLFEPEQCRNFLKAAGYASD